MEDPPRGGGAPRPRPPRKLEGWAARHGTLWYVFMHVFMYAFVSVRPYVRATERPNVRTTITITITIQQIQVPPDSALFELNTMTKSSYPYQSRNLIVFCEIANKYQTKPNQVSTVPK